MNQEFPHGCLTLFINRENSICFSEDNLNSKVSIIFVTSLTIFYHEWKIREISYHRVHWFISCIHLLERKFQYNEKISIGNQQNLCFRHCFVLFIEKEVATSIKHEFLHHPMNYVYNHLSDYTHVIGHLSMFRVHSRTFYAQVDQSECRIRYWMLKYPIIRQDPIGIRRNKSDRIVCRIR